MKQYTLKPDDEEGILRDGQSVRVPIHLMDSLQKSVAASTADRRSATARHSPGGATLTDAERQARSTMLQSADRKLSERWKKNPTTVATLQPAKDAQPAPAPTTDMAAQYAAYDQRVSQRWRSGGAA